MRTVFTGLEATAVSSPRRWRKGALLLGSCATAFLLGWLAIRLWMTYLPAPADHMVRLDRRGGVGVVTVERDAGDLSRLQERVRATAQAVLPSVVAVRNPFQNPSEVGRHRTSYASGVIITADGLVLSQWHVSHRKLRGDGDSPPSRPDSWTTGLAGERTTVILQDGRECPAELLGANRDHDLSLLRLLEPGPYPHVPIGAEAPVAVGDWVLKIGHPLGYRKDRPAPVRLGRVIGGTAEIFGSDCMVSGGDSGGPYFGLDGKLLGIVHSNNGILGLNVWNVTGNKLVDSLLDAMRRGEVSPYVREEVARRSRELETGTRLQAEDHSQGSATLARYRSIVEPTCSSVVVVLNTGVAVGLGTVVGAEGWVVTKASELPGLPACRLPSGRVVPARVVGVDLAFDLALLSVPATDLKPVRWADDFHPPVGTLLAAVGTERPLGVGVVSVPRRDLDAPARLAGTLPLRMPAGRPLIHGTPEPIPGFSPDAAFGLPRSTVFHVWGVRGLAESAGMRPHDRLYGINGRQIRAESDLLEAIRDQCTGDVVPVRLERAGTLVDLKLPLAAETGHGDISYRADDFPTVIECAVPFASYECGGPIVDLSGRAIGVTIARPGVHGGMVVPGDVVLKLLPDLRSGRFAGNWAPTRPPAK